MASSHSDSDSDSDIDSNSTAASSGPLPPHHRPSNALGVRVRVPVAALLEGSVPRHSLNLVEQMAEAETKTASAAAAAAAPSVEDDGGKATFAEPIFEPHHPPRTFTSTSTAVSVSVLAFPAGGDDASGPNHVTLVRLRHGYVLRARPKLEHNLFFIMGFMEMANACDFAANVWNIEPVPVVATVLMAIGGTVAGVFSLFTLRDTLLAWHNVCFLRQQRRGLLEARAQYLKQAPNASVIELDALLDVSYRELGTEFVCRFVLDVFMGIGAIFISIGTYMALGGKNPTIYAVSNLLSGYVGNAPVAAVGLFVSAWAAYLWLKARAHYNAVITALPGTRAATLVKRRSRNVQIYCVINGLTTIMGGIGSMITATRWWGYVILIPVILSAIFCNYWWRSRVGYARHDLFGAAMRVGSGINVDELTTALEFAARAGISVRNHRCAPLDGLIPDATSLYQVVHFIAEQDLLESYCLRLVNNAKLRNAICGAFGESAEIKLDIPLLCAVPDVIHPAMIEEAQEMIRQIGSEHFKFRERHTAELLGSYLSLLSASPQSARGQGQDSKNTSQNTIDEKTGQ